MINFENKTWLAVSNFVKNLKNFDEGTKYAKNVFEGKIKTSSYILKQCARHLLFLFKEKTDPTFPYQFLKERGEKFVNFTKKIVVPEINKAFVFPPFRKFTAFFIFGWVHKNDNQKLLTKEVFETAARKQWKSSFWASVMLAVSLGILGDGNPQVYISGPQRETSKVPYDIAKNYIFKSPKLQSYFSVYNTLHIKTTKFGIIKHLPFEKASLEGKNPSMVVLTEYHLHKDDEMTESAISSRNLSRKNQLIVFDTTKGADVQGVGFKREHSYKKFLDYQIENPDEHNRNAHIFLSCHELDNNDYENWTDSTLWYKANPALNISVSMEDLLDEFNSITDTSSRNEFQIKRLGMWVGGASNYFASHTVINSFEATEKIITDYKNNNNLKSLNAIIGVDLSSTIDTTAVVINFEIPQPDGESIMYFIPHIFIPSQNLLKKEKSDQADYREWAEKGYVTIIEGEVIRYDVVETYIKKLAEEYNVISLAYDQWQFQNLKLNLINHGIFEEEQLIPVRQGIRLSPAFKEFERKLLLKKIAFESKELFYNHITNTTAKVISTGENIIPQKISTNSRIDAFIAALNCLTLRFETDPNTNQPIFYTIAPNNLKN